MNNYRKLEAWEKRDEANRLASQRPHPRHISNGDEQKFRHKAETACCHKSADSDGGYALDENAPSIKGKPSYLMSFTKGMPHDKHTGLLKNPLHFQYFVRAIDSGDPRDFRDTPLGPDGHCGSVNNCYPPEVSWKSHKARNGADENPVGLRAWESQSAGLAFELEGPDAQAVTMPPAPSLGSDELTAEMAEVYVQALLRDVPFHAMSTGVVCNSKIAITGDLKALKTTATQVKKVKEYTDLLGKLPWFGKSASDLCLEGPERKRHRGAHPDPGTAFRGITPGDDIGPYLSQFLLIGDNGLNGRDPDPERSEADGLISYGAISVDQRVRTATPGCDYMTTWEEWLDVQQAANVTGLETYEDRRFIFTPRDLSTYVHFDALYEAYLNACLILLANKAPFDPGIPFQDDDSRDHQQGFAHFGGPHILSLVTEVATRALKAVRFQKYNVHRRCRPEVLAARITKVDDLKDVAKELPAVVDALKHILPSVDKHNTAQNAKDKEKIISQKLANNHLLPMAFCEGSPMHPAYGAGHATVAGACVTILKAFFDSKQAFKPNGQDADQAYVSVNGGKELKLVPVLDRSCRKVHLTVEGELNKLASNISIGRDWAGVHYFSDYIESILMGEQIAIGILEEQKLMFQENFSVSVPLFCGDTIRI